MPTLNPAKFLQQFDRFKQLVLGHDAQGPLSFGSGLPYEEEHYKEVVYHEGRDHLDWNDWTDAQIGTGDILRHVIEAIEIKKSNLVDWDLRRGPKARSHHEMCVALENNWNLTAWESLFFDLYRDQLSPEEAFDELVRLIGRRYDVVAYLFYLKDWSRFAPIAPETFDRAFQMLGVSLKTRHQCSWPNYQSFIDVLRQIREALRKEGCDDVRLIDAHTFCWMIARTPMPEAGAAVLLPPEPFLGPLHFVHIGSGREPLDLAKRAPIDWDLLRRRQSELGDLAEQRAMDSERLRLDAAGRADLAAQVRLVSEDHTLGYDIKSFNVDGTDRYIEVKAARESGDVFSFIVSDNEFRRSRELENYYFYLVLEARDRPLVRELAAEKITAEMLSSIAYYARFRAAHRLI
jgi:hypothetical protein